MVDPKERLGADITEGNGIEELKAHPFFKGINFANIHTINVPISENSRKTLELERKADNNPFKNYDLDSDDDWKINQDEIAHSNTAINLNKEKKLEENIQSGNSKGYHKGAKSEIPRKDQNIDNMNGLLDNPGEYHKCTIVEKRNKWYFFQNRTLKLTKDLRLMYFKKNVYRGDITLSKQVSVRKEKIHHFEIVTPHKIFHFKCKEGDSATHWVKLIRAAIKEKVKKEKQKR